MPKKNKFNGSINKPFVPEKKKDDKKARNVAIVLLLVLAFCCFGSVLAIGLTVKDCITASAEEIVSEEVPVPEGYPNLIHLQEKDYPFSSCTYVSENTFTCQSFYNVPDLKYVTRNIPQKVFLKPNTYYTAYISFSNIPEGYTVPDLILLGYVRLTPFSVLYVPESSSGEYRLAFGLTYTGSISDQPVVFDSPVLISVGLWEGNFSNSDFASSVYYQAGLLQGQTDGYKLGYNEGYSKGGDDYAKSLSSSASSIFANADIKYVADVFDEDDHAEWSTTIIPTIDNQSIMFDRFTIPADKESMIDDDKVVVTFNSGLLFDPTTFIFQGFPHDMTVNFVFTYKNGHKFKNVYSVSSSGILVSYFGGGTDLTTGQTQVFDFSSVASIDSMTMTFTHLRMFKDYADVLVLSIAQGYGLGYAKGIEEQKNIDYNVWYMGRYNQGYSDGVKAAGEYTFLSLLGAVVDAPLQAVSGMLNFNLLGFNMLNFFYALLTCALVIAVIRLIL